VVVVEFKSEIFLVSESENCLTVDGGSSGCCRRRKQRKSRARPTRSKTTTPTATPMMTHFLEEDEPLESGVSTVSGGEACFAIFFGGSFLRGIKSGVK
ncbi:hypothetical protein A2U01_0070903, partial [Trifolium medium]|nr:hypothetical protein [Trifolium medium]